MLDWAPLCHYGRVMERSKRDDARRLGAGFVLSRGQEAVLALAWELPAPTGPEFAVKGTRAGQSQRQGRWVPSAPSTRGGGGWQCSTSTELEVVAEVLTPALLLAGCARSNPGHCYDLAASEGCGQCCCLQGFERLLLAFLFKEFHQKSRTFYSLPPLSWLCGICEESLFSFFAVNSRD